MSRRHIVATFILAGLGALASSARAEVKLPEVFSDGAVLQRGVPIVVWGYAAAGEKVTVTLDGQSASAVAEKIKAKGGTKHLPADSWWQVALPARKAGGPFTMTVKGANTIEVKDVLVGDVWLASGQSNMDVRTPKPIAEADRRPTVRQFTGHHPGYKKGAYPLGKWTTGGYWYLTAWPFAKAVADSQKVPVGILCCARGGSPVSTWRAQKKFHAPHPKYPACYSLYIEPIMPFRIKGAIWWQGENDSWGLASDRKRLRYRDAFSEVITGWRKEWGQGDFPFLYVQLQRRPASKPFAATPTAWQWGNLGQSLNWIHIRDGQRLTLALPSTAMVVSFDVTPSGDLHPTASEKQKIGRRLALAAEAVAYGKDVEWSGPLFKAVSIKDGKVVVEFTHTTGGLVAQGGALKEFQVGNSRGFADVDAAIEGNTVTFPAKGLPRSFQVRYAWHIYPHGNLYNGKGLPASPFLSDPVGQKK